MYFIILYNKKETKKTTLKLLLVVMSYNVVVSPTPPRLTGVDRVLHSSYVRLGLSRLG